MAQTNFTAGDMYPKAVKPVVVAAPEPTPAPKKAKKVVEEPVAVVEETIAEESVAEEVAE